VKKYYEFKISQLEYVECEINKAIIEHVIDRMMSDEAMDRLLIAVLGGGIDGY
jgi:hypothetical protein